MKKFIQESYEAYTNSDLTEGRGRDVTIGYFTKEEDARKASFKEGVMGTNASVRRKMFEVIVYESFEEFQNQKTASTVGSLGLTKDQIEYIKKYL